VRPLRVTLEPLRTEFGGGFQKMHSDQSSDEGGVFACCADTTNMSAANVV
jgi:hypothetical protein